MVESLLGSASISSTVGMAASGTLMAATHLPFPGLVQLKVKGDSFVATPVKLATRGAPGRPAFLSRVSGAATLSECQGPP
jgi:hypothetical protein